MFARTYYTSVYELNDITFSIILDMYFAFRVEFVFFLDNNKQIIICLLSKYLNHSVTEL